eukprot:885317-Prorocentrum_minimum.AAC.1
MFRSRHALLALLLVVAIVPFVLIPTAHVNTLTPAFPPKFAPDSEVPLGETPDRVTIPDSDDSDDTDDDTDDAEEVAESSELLHHLASVAGDSRGSEGGLRVRWRWKWLNDLLAKPAPPTLSVKVRIHEPVTEPWWLETPPPVRPKGQNDHASNKTRQLCEFKDATCAKSASCKQDRKMTTRCEKRCIVGNRKSHAQHSIPTCRECSRIKPVRAGGCEETELQCKRARVACMRGKVQACNGHLKWISMWDENQYVPHEFYGWANLGFTANITNITAGAKLGLRHLYKATPLFWERSGTPKSPLRLRADYKEQWEVMWPTLVELYRNGSVVGFVLGDELVWMGVDWGAIETAANLIRHDFPGAIIWMNEAISVVRGHCNHFHVCSNFTHVPAAISWFSLDRYWTTAIHKDHANRLRESYEKHLIPKLNSNQSIVLVPGGFASKYNSKKCNFNCYEEFMTRDALDYLDWAIEDGRIAAIIPYHWHYCPGCKSTRNEIGVQGMNLTRAMWRSIGRSVVERSNTWVRPVPEKDVSGWSEDAWLIDFNHTSLHEVASHFGKGKGKISNSGPPISKHWAVTFHQNIG